MMMNMTEDDYESWRDEIHCAGYEEPNQGGEYGSQYSAAALYDGGWRSVDIPEIIALYKLSDEEAEQIANDLRKIEQGNEEG